MEPAILLQLVYALGLTLVIIGVVKLVIYFIGEIKPAIWNFIKSEALRKCFQGLPNRLIFGLGGLVTVLLGVLCIGLLKVLEPIFEAIP